MKAFWWRQHQYADFDIWNTIYDTPFKIIVHWCDRFTAGGFHEVWGCSECATPPVIPQL